jgi:hypothetical protein
LTFPRDRATMNGREPDSLPPGRSWDKMPGIIAQLQALHFEGRAEREKRRSAGGDTGFYEEALTQLEEVIIGMQDLRTIHRVISSAEVHGKGPYSLEELSALTDTEVPRMQRVMDKLILDGTLFLG